MSPTNNPLRVADVRERNEKLVLRLIRESGAVGLSQSETVVATGLRAPTILRIFSSLEEAGFIEPRTGASAKDNDRERKGRPRISYIVKAGALYSLGVEFWVDSVTLGIFDFRGTRIASRVRPLPRGTDADTVTDLIAEEVDSTIDSLGLERSLVLGLGLGAPGQVNVGKREIAFYSRIPGMRDFPIASRLEERLGFPVSIHNNCAVIALSEFRYGGLVETDSLFMFLLRSGVNGAFINKGKIYLASDGTTIETGHITVDYEGLPCACGARGCLESYITALERPTIEAGKWLFEGMSARIEAGDEDATTTLREAARYLSAAMRTVSRLFRPRTFLIEAVTVPIASRLSALVAESLEESASGFDTPMPLFEARAYDPELAQRGAADLVIDAFLS